MSQFRAAAIQMTSGDDIAANIAQAQGLLQQAVQQGAHVVALPENAFFMRREGSITTPDVAMQHHAGIAWAQQAARQYGVWVLVGSIRALEGAGKPYNRSVLVTPTGAIGATYDKLHLFDVTLADGDRYEESAQARAGAVPVVARTSLGSFGLSICYDIRFPGLYRAMARAGADILTVPSAFTRPTGQAHWEVLLRARAIENGCYVIAPAQAGTHPGGRKTYGHSMMIDPWGAVIACAQGDMPQVVMADIDTARVAQVRASIPVLQHHRALADVTLRDLLLSGG